MVASRCGRNPAPTMSDMAALNIFYCRSNDVPTTSNFRLPTSTFSFYGVIPNLSHLNWFWTSLETFPPIRAMKMFSGLRQMFGSLVWNS